MYWTSALCSLFHDTNGIQIPMPNKIPNTSCIPTINVKFISSASLVMLMKQFNLLKIFEV